MSNRFNNWLKERIPLEGLNYKVPRHANTLLFTLGGITLISIVVLIITGVILAQFYTPTPEEANSSIRAFITDNSLGTFIRSLHFWAAQVAIVTVILHLLRVFIYGSYKKTREINWLLGVVLFIGTIGLYYTGTILRWDQEAYEALAHTLEAAEIVGLDFSDTSIPILTKLFSLHTSVLPLLFFVVAAGHLILVKFLGISPLPWKSKSKENGNSSEEESTFKVHFKHLVGYGFLAFGIMTILSVIFPTAIGSQPVAGIESTTPSWVFMSIFSIENWFGLGGLVVASILVVIALVIVPFIDRSSSHFIVHRKGIITLGAIMVILVIALTVNAYLTKPEQHIGMGESEPNNEVEEQTDIEIVPDDQEDQNTDEADEANLSVELKALNQALVVVDEIDNALKSGNVELAGEKAALLDEVIDAIGPQIKAKDAALRAELGDVVHELGELQETTNPDMNKVNKELELAKEKINETKKLFSPEANLSVELKALNQALAVVDEIGNALKAGNVKLAGEKAVLLDDVVDAIGPQIKAKDAALRAELGDVVHELGELQETTNPDMNKVNKELELAKEKINEAKKLF